VWFGPSTQPVSHRLYSIILGTWTLVTSLMLARAYSGLWCTISLQLPPGGEAPADGCLHCYCRHRRGGISLCAYGRFWLMWLSRACLQLLRILYPLAQVNTTAGARQAFLISLSPAAAGFRLGFLSHNHFRATLLKHEPQQAGVRSSSN